MLPLLALYLPLMRVLLVGLTLPMAFAPTFVLALAAGLYAPWFAALRLSAADANDAPEQQDRPWPLAALLCAANAALCLCWGGWQAGYGADQARPSHLAWLYDAVNDEAWWYSRDRQPDQYTGGFFPPNARLRELPQVSPDNALLWVSGAPGKLPPPHIEVLADRMAQDGSARVLRLRLHSPRAAPQLRWRIKGRLRAAWVEGVRVEAPLNSPWSWQAHAFGAQGVQLELQVEPGSRLHIALLDRSFGLPPGGQPVPPVTIMPQPFRDAWTTQVYSEQEL